jgi:adenylyl cyclase-associated protein
LAGDWHCSKPVRRYVFKCEGSTVKVNGKCNNIVIDSCKKVALVFDTVVSGCEFINCQSVQMQVGGIVVNIISTIVNISNIDCFQVLGRVNTIMVDKTDGCQMFLNKVHLL